MKGFNFKLENILKVKQLREDLEKAQLATLQNRYQEEEKSLLNLQDCLLSYQCQLREKQTGVMTVEMFNLYRHYFNKTNQDISKQEEVLVNLELEVTKQRDELVERVKERKILENLKQKKYYEFRKIILNEEQLFLDEIATNNYVRPKG